MLIHRELRGDVLICDCKETQEILGKLKGLVKHSETEKPLRVKSDAEGIRIILDYAGDMTATFSQALDDTLREFNPYTACGARFISAHNQQKSSFYIGSKEQRKEAASDYVITRIAAMAKELLPEDIERAVEVLKRGVLRQMHIDIKANIRKTLKSDPEDFAELERIAALEVRCGGDAF